MSSTSVPAVTLNNGVTIPQLGFGVFQIPADEAQQAVERAIAAGYRHIDTAAGYYNEAGVGAGVRASGVPREEIFVTTKVRNVDQGTERTLAAFEASNTALGLDYIDLLLIHWPVPSRDRYVETWKTLETLLARGSVRAIGVSNFLPEHLDRLLAETEIVPAVNQVELHPTFTNDAVVAATRAKGIAVEAYSPLGQGKDLSASAVTQLAEAYGKTPAQIVLRWHLQQGTIVIPKSVTPERIAENIDVFDFSLTDADIAAISALNTDERIGADPATADFAQTRSRSWDEE
ncbi:MAG TPA: aldo/keto reductase [Thermomicrobiales bacterium]|nr:aldo/keto reductase [Thermomicrobiales bacterium]